MTKYWKEIVDPSGSTIFQVKHYVKEKQKIGVEV